MNKHDVYRRYYWKRLRIDLLGQGVKHKKEAKRPIGKYLESHELIDSVIVLSFLLCEPGMHWKRNEEID